MASGSLANTRRSRNRRHKERNSRGSIQFVVITVMNHKESCGNSASVPVEFDKLDPSVANPEHVSNVQRRSERKRTMAGARLPFRALLRAKQVKVASKT